MYRAVVDGFEVGTYKKVSTAKEKADEFMELGVGGFSATIYRGHMYYSHRFFNSQWASIYGPVL